jgi:hypothetical protein
MTPGPRDAWRREETGPTRPVDDQIGRRYGGGSSPLGVFPALAQVALPLPHTTLDERVAPLGSRG